MNNEIKHTARPHTGHSHRYAICVLASAVFSFASLQAADYFLATNNGQWNQAVWVRLGDTAATKVAPSAGNVYWVVSGFTDSASGTSSAANLYTSATSPSAPICIGSPADSPFGARSGNLLRKWGVWEADFPEIRWYNGNLQGDTYSHTYKGRIVLYKGGESAVHKYVYDPGYYVKFSNSLVSDTPDVAISVQRQSGLSALTKANLDSASKYFAMTGDNFRYKGAFVMTASCPFYPFQIGGDHSLGNPYVPNAAALCLPDNGAVRVLATAGMQSSARGIRLDGNTAYLVVNAGASVLRYSVSRTDGVAGTLVKYGNGTNTLDCAYSAGDIVVEQGVLRIGGGASFPDGQAFTVKDGARLEIGYCPGLRRHTVTCEGTGAYGYTDGVSPTADGGWTWTTTPQDVVGSGFTATFADRVLTINVDSGSTASYDYSSLAAIGCITNIVKTGAGTWTPAVAPNYYGDFTLMEGTTRITELGQFGAEGFGTVRKASGATLSLSGNKVLVRGKRMILAGTVNSSNSGTWSNGVLSDCDITLTGNLNWVEGSTHLAFANRSFVDMCGFNITLTAKDWCQSQLSYIVVTNSSATASKISPYWNRQLRLGDGAELWGGSRNSIEASSSADANEAFIFVGYAKGDWTLKPGASSGSNPSGVRAGQASSRNVTSYGYDGPMAISGYTKFNFSQNNGCLTFGGPVSGSGTIDVLGGVVNFNGSGSTFSGAIALTNATSTTLPAAICVGEGASLPGATVKINAGTLSFKKALPVTASPVFAAGTTLDMNGEDLTIAGLTGSPTIANPAHLTITGAWTIPSSYLLAGTALDLGVGSLEFGPSASLVVQNRPSSLKACSAARASGGISGLPSVTGWNAVVSVSGGELRLYSPGMIIVFR